MTEQAHEEVKQVETEDVVTAFEISAASEKGVDYEKLIKNYGCFHISQEQIDRVERLTGKKPHRFIRRGIFFCQRDFDEILKAYEAKKPFYLYTGRGPSTDAMHMGHCIPMMFTQYLQEAFDVPLVIQITDDEKYLYN
jgi:tryptophanyl-tRNA synthetase